MKKSVDKIMMGKLLNAGQICVSPDYVFVQEDQTEEFVQHAKDHVAENYPTIKNNPDYTSIIHLNHFERLNELVQDAKSKGANAIVCFRFQTSTITQGASEILAYGTGIKI